MVSIRASRSWPTGREAKDRPHCPNSTNHTTQGLRAGRQRTIPYSERRRRGRGSKRRPWTRQTPRSLASPLPGGGGRCLTWRLRWARVEAAGAPYLRLPCRSRSNCAALQTSPSPATLMLLSRMKDVIASEQRARETPSTYGARKTEASSSTNRMALKQKSPSNCSCTSRVCARPRQCLGMKCVWRTTLAMASSGSKTGVPSPITARLTASSTPRQAPHQTRLCPAKCRSIRTSFTDARKMTSAAKLPLTKATNRAICWAMGVGNCEMYSTAASRLAARRCSRRCSTSLNSLRHHLAYGDQLRAATELGWW
mmetsp:Transcript_572/g.1288  ORF Transcript_572/g.1288 Transcript_572/m.1288 type:complete len:311 (-) Transcript_572:1104-2036(-)